MKRMTSKGNKEIAKQFKLTELISVFDIVGNVDAWITEFDVGITETEASILP